MSIYQTYENQIAQSNLLWAIFYYYIKGLKNVNLNNVIELRMTGFGVEYSLTSTRI